MTFSLQSLFPILAAVCAAVIVYGLLIWLFSRRPSSDALLRDYGSPQAVATVTEARVGSQEHKIRMAFAGYGFDVSGREQFSLYLAIGVLGLGFVIVLATLGMPPLFWLAGPAIAYFGINSLVNGKWNKVRMAMEKEIPSFILIPWIWVSVSKQKARHPITESYHRGRLKPNDFHRVTRPAGQ
ncbi:MAG TPA: hypothetical protein PKM21_18925 [Anaerolineales bacterium]|nr:hypothetical protein [Anaerolineales bacterium]